MKVIWNGKLYFVGDGPMDQAWLFEDNPYKLFPVEWSDPSLIIDPTDDEVLACK